MLAVRGELVHMEYLDPDPSVAPMAVDGDDPRIHASAERGDKILDLQLARMQEWINATLFDID